MYYFNKFTLAAQDFKLVKNKMIHRESSGLGAQAPGRKKRMFKKAPFTMWNYK